MDRRQWTLAVLMGGIHFIFHVFVRLLPPLIPLFTVAFEYPLWKLGLLVSAYFVGSSIGLLPMGVLADRYDRRSTLSASLAVVGAGYVLFAFAETLGGGLPTTVVSGHAVDGTFAVMTLSMLVSGFGTSAHVPVGVPLLTSNATPGNRGKILGIWGGGSKLGDAVGPALVGVLIVVFSWQTILLGFGVLGVASAVLLFVLLGRSEFDTRPGTEQTESDGTPGTGERLRSDRQRYLYPMLVLMGYFAAYQVVVQGAVTFIPTFITDVYGYTLSLAGVFFAPESFADFALSVLLVAAAFGRFVGGALVDRYEHRAVLFGSLVVAAVAFLAFSVLSLGPLALVAVLVVFGVALWGNSPARDSFISDMTPAAREGRTFSYLWTVSRVFGAVSPTVVGLLSGTVGIRRSFSYLAVATLVAGLFVALLFSSRVYATGTTAEPTDAPSD